MFNKTDDSGREQAACCAAASAVKQDVPDYFCGLPDPPLVVPKNILLFSRKKSFGHRVLHHHRFLLITCLRGKGSVIVDSRLAHLNPGCALLVTPYQFHHYGRFTNPEMLWLFLTFELDNEEEFNFLRGRVLKMSPMQMTYLRQLAERYTELNGKRTASPEITLLAALLLEEFRITAASGRKAVPLTKESGVSRRLVQDVARYVNSHAAETIRIPDVARALGYSESHLRARFRALADIGLGAYIRRLRLHRARTIMLTSGLRLQEIAERCGYDSIYTFSRAFRKEMGTSPSRYRHRGPDYKKK